MMVPPRPLMSWCAMRIARTSWPSPLVLLLSGLCHILYQAVGVADAKGFDSLDDETALLPPPPPPAPETLAVVDPPTATPTTAALVITTALRLFPALTDLTSFLALFILAIFVAALVFLLVFHVALNWRPFQKCGRAGSVKGNNTLTTTGESSECQLTPATPTASSPLPSDRTSQPHATYHTHPVDATTSSSSCFRGCCSPCDFFCCLAPPPPPPPPRQPGTSTTAAKTAAACSHYPHPTASSRDIKAADSISTFFHTPTTNDSDTTQIIPSAPATPPDSNRFAGCEAAASSLPTSPLAVPTRKLSQRRMISVPSLTQLSQVGQPEHVQPVGFDGRQLVTAALPPSANISEGSLSSMGVGGGRTSGLLPLGSAAAVCVIPQQAEVVSAPRTPVFSQPTDVVSGLHRLSTISASLSDVVSASAAAPDTDSKAVLGHSVDELGTTEHWHSKPTLSTAGDSASHDALKRSFTTTSASRGQKRSLLESRRGSHTSLTLVLSPLIDSSHATAHQPSSRGGHGSTSFLAAPRGHSRSTRYPPTAATPSVSLHRPYGAGEASSAAFCSPSSSSEDPSSSAASQSRPRQQQQQQQQHTGSQGAAATAGGTAVVDDQDILYQASLPLTGQQLETKLREDVASLFSEFWSIPINLTNKCGLTGVGQKNRYAGIIPNNETRVILPQTNNDELTTYINANYIHGYAGVPRAFIATQGPMTHTVNDFWRMIWHTRAPAIVMLTRLIESGKVKCEFYLPDSKFEMPTTGRSGPGRADTVPGGSSAGSGSSSSTADPPTAGASVFLKSANSFPAQRGGGGARKFVGRTGATDEEETDLSRTCARAGSQQMFGSVLVRVDSVVLKPGYTKRLITLKQGDEEHKVTHFWYVAWPDHSSPEATPTAARHLLHLVHETEACRYGRGGATSGAPQSFSSPSTPSAATVTSPAPLPSLAGVLPPPPPPRRFLRQHAEERTDAELLGVEKGDEEEEEEAEKETADFYSPANRGYRASDPLAVATGPVVVHCSAGIGRTGCFIALCIGCEQLRREDKVDVFGIVNRLRLDRGGMVEDHSQYVFLHIALATFYSLQRGLAPPEFPVIDLSLGFPRPGR